MKIWKYPLDPSLKQTLSLPVGAKILDVQVQDNTPCLWALVNENTQVKESRHLVMYFTGSDIPDEPGDYIATFQLNGLVIHLFQISTDEE
jgi:hypothetical protein